MRGALSVTRFRIADGGLVDAIIIARGADVRGRVYEPVEPTKRRLPVSRQVRGVLSAIGPTAAINKGGARPLLSAARGASSMRPVLDGEDGRSLSTTGLSIRGVLVNLDVQRHPVWSTPALCTAVTNFSITDRGVVYPRATI